MIKIRIIILIFLVCGLPAYGQNTIGLPRIINFNNSIFQGGTQTWDIRQDPSGRMYFANNDGLLTFDGSYWKLYPQPNKTILRSIALHNNRIYAGGQDEIGYYAPDAQGVLRYTTLKNLIPVQYASFTDVWEIEVFRQSVFFRTWDRIFEYRDGLIKTYPAESGWHTMRKSGNQLFAQDKFKGLFRFVNDKWEPLNSKGDPISFELTGLVALGQDSLLVSSLENGIYLYTKGKLSKKTTDADADFIKNHIYCLEQINNNEFVAGTTSGGCIVINAEGKVIQQFARPEGLQNNNVLSVFLDREKNLWTGLDNGISFIAYNAPIKYIKPAKPDELSGYSVRVFDNALYIATSDGAYAAPLSFSAKDLSFSRSDFVKISNSSGQNWRLDVVNERLLLGHHTGSFLISGNQAKQLTKDAGSWIFMPVSNVFPASQVVTGTYNGLSLLQYGNEDFTSLGDITGMKESLRFLAMDNNNHIWASHPYRGIYRIMLTPNGRSYKYELFTEKDGLPSTLRNNVFRVKNRVVFATEQGVYEYDPAKKKFRPSELLFDIFGNNTVQYLTEDEEGNVWFCSGKKVGVVNFKTGEPVVTWFPELTGKMLAGFEFIYPYNPENIFLASSQGIIHLNYKKYITGHSNPDMLLTQVMLSGKKDSLIFGGYYENRKDSASKLAMNKILRFGSGDNSFHFEFSSPVFGLQSNVEYSYRLKGYDKQWSVPSSKTEKEYTNLPEGSYTFEVKAFDNLGNESKVISYSFEISPPWYKSIWAYVFYTVLLFALLYLGNRWQQKKFIRQQMLFEEEQKRLKYIHQLEVEKNEKEIIQLQN
ncbi:MAG: triple tyrosine motif-containing protein [Flavisolibacter sp.]